MVPEKNMTDDSVPVVNPEFIQEEFNDETILYTAAGTSAVYLNETSLLILKLCGETKTVGEIIDFLENSYPEEKKTIREDVLSALKTLIDSGVISLSNDRK